MRYAARIISYLGVAYLGAAIAFVLPFGSGAYDAVSSGAQVVAALLGR